MSDIILSIFWFLSAILFYFSVSKEASLIAMGISALFMLSYEIKQEIKKCAL